MKIVMLIDALNRGGQERQLIELLKGFQEKPAYSIEVVLFSKNIQYPEIHDLRFPIHIIERKPKKDPRAFVKVYRIFQKFQPDLVHSWSAMASIYASPACRFLGLKFINQHIMDSAKGLNWTKGRYTKARLSYPFSDVIISNSKSGLTAYDVPEKKALCIYNGFDLNRGKNLLPEAEVRQKFGIQTPKVVGMVGAFHNRKDYDTYIKAACWTVSKRPDVTFLAIGGGGNIEKCKALVPEQYKEQIIFTGMLPNVESVINIFDVAVLCTNTDVHQEGISNSIIEYMFFEKPVVATRGGGTNEIVIPDQTGVLVDVFDVEGLSNAITNLIDHPAKAKQLGQNARQLIHDGFSLERMRKDYVELYAKYV